MYDTHGYPPYPVVSDKMDLSWTNRDWMLTYGALKELILLYDFQKKDEVEVGRQQEIAEGLIEKLEFMFREHDEASGK